MPAMQLDRICRITETDSLIWQFKAAQCDPMPVCSGVSPSEDISAYTTVGVNKNAVLFSGEFILCLGPHSQA